MGGIFRYIKLGTSNDKFGIPNDYKMKCTAEILHSDNKCIMTTIYLFGDRKIRRRTICRRTIRRGQFVVGQFGAGSFSLNNLTRTIRRRTIRREQFNADKSSRTIQLKQFGAENCC